MFSDDVAMVQPKFRRKIISNIYDLNAPLYIFKSIKKLQEEFMV